MSDIVERLRAPAYWISGSSEGHEGDNSAPLEAAAEIERLRAGGCARDQGTTQFCAEAAEKDERIRILERALRIIAEHPVEKSGKFEVGAREMIKVARIALGEQSDD